MKTDGQPLSVTVRVLLPRPAFDPAFASSIFVEYIQGSPNPLRRPLPAADGGNGRLIYSIDFPADLMTVDSPAALTTGLAFNKVTRRLLKSPPVNAPVTTYPLTMTVTDLNGNGDSAAYLFTIQVQEDTDPVFADNAETVFTVDLTVAMTLTLPEATDGNRETRYSAITEDAPPGMMNFDPQTRELSGTPTEAASLHFVFDYIATDPDEDYDENGIPHSADDDITMRMISVFVDGKPSFGAQTVPAQNYIVNSQITNLTLSVATGGNGDLMYSLAPLPTGLTFNSDPNSLVLSGTPESAGTSTLIYMVTDSDPDPAYRDSATLSVTVNIVGDDTPIFTPNTFATRNYIETWLITPVVLPEATGGNGAISLTILGLPQGLTFDFDPETGTLSGTLSGTPTEDGTFPITLIAHDSDGNDSDIGKLEFTIIVAPDIDPVLSGIVGNQGYIQNSPITELTLSVATGGNGGVTMYSLAPLPTGLTFDMTTRVLSGTPEEAGVFPVTYTATDSDPVDPDSVTESFELNIAQDLVPFFTESVPQQNYFEGATIAMTVLPEASGGNGDPLTYEESGLPDGIAFNRTSRELSGAPTEFGSFVATIVARDTDGNMDESDNGVLTFGISVEADTQPSFGSLTVSNQTYTLSVRISPLRLPAATGGNGQLIYSVSDDLPPGLAFNDNTQTDNTRIINLTPTTAGTYTVVYTVEDGDGDTRSLTFTITVVAS